MNIRNITLASLLFLGLMLAIPNLAAATDASGITLQNISGEVLLKNNGNPLFELTACEQKLAIGDVVQTTRGSHCTINFHDKAIATINPSSLVEIQDDSFRLKIGDTWLFFKKDGSKFKVLTPSAVIGVRGTVFDVRVVLSGRSDVKLYEGEINVADNAGKEYTLKSGNRCTLDTGCKYETAPLTAKELDGSPIKANGSDPRVKIQKIDQVMKQLKDVPVMQFK